MFILCLLISIVFLIFLSFRQIWSLIDNLELTLYTGVLNIFKQCLSWVCISKKFLSLVQKHNYFSLF
jgi:presenilin-like A22 family membrane protease